MNGNEFYWLTSHLSKILNGWGVFGISSVIAIIFILIYRRNKSRQLLNSLPGLFTSLGLLGTFVAICNSLGDIHEDSLEIDVIIRNLIPAFTSSIAGLISAFIATAACKIFYSYEDKKLDDKVNRMSPEECLYDISKQLTKQESQNKEYNDRLNSTISQQSAILEKFINDFVEKMDDIFISLHGRIEQNIKDFGEEQFKNCADTLEALTNKLSALSTGLLEEQKTNVKQMIEGTNTELQSVSNNVTEQITTLCTQMNSALASLNSSQNERLTSIVDNYNSLSERLASQNSDFAEKINSQMNAEREKFVEVNQQMLHSTTSMNREVSAELRQSLSSFVSDLQMSVSNEVNMLREAITTNVEELRKSYSYISDHVANIKGNYESAAQAYIDAVNTSHRMNESQENMLSTINDSMKHVAHTNEKIDEVIDVIEERQERIENLISHINEISTTIETLQKLESQLNRIANK